jgi:hypothetical protein
MTPAQLKALLLRLPELQRAYARKKINAAIDAGWKNVGLWCYQGFDPHHADLVGQHPADGFDFLPDVDSDG